MAKMFRLLICLTLPVWFGSFANAQKTDWQWIGLESAVSTSAGDSQLTQVDSQLYDKVEPIKYSEICQRLFGRMTGLMLTARKIECRFNKTADWTVAVTREIAAILETASTNLERLYLLKLENDCFVLADEFEPISSCEAFNNFHNCRLVFGKITSEDWAGRFAQTQNAIFFAAKCRLDPFFKRTSRARWWTLESCFLNAHEWSWTWSAIENLSDNGVRMIRVVDRVVNRLTKSLKSAVSALRGGILFPNQLEFDCCRRVSN